VGSVIAYWQKDPQKIVNDLMEVKPTYFPSVPRIFEKLYALAMANAPDPEALKKAVAVGIQVRMAEERGEEVAPELRKAFDGVEVKIADDGEILLRGENIFAGYFKNEDATAEALVDGWLHTGDLGHMDEDGFLYITGRKKDIIITAGGKNITPANLENDVKQCRWVSQCVVLGDRRPYLVALVTIDPEEVPAFAQEHGLDPEEVVGSEQMRAEVQKAID